MEHPAKPVSPEHSLLNVVHLPAEPGTSPGIAGSSVLLIRFHYPREKS